MPAVLSTKLLSSSQKNLLLNAGLSLTEYNAIHTKVLNVPISIAKDHYPNAIITSQTTVELIKEFSIGTCYCVGEKTAAKLKALGFDVRLSAASGQNLAQNLIEGYANLKFTFFGSAKRRPEFSDALNKANIPLSEIFVYDTLKNPKPYHRDFDAVLCFSPLGVESFFEANPHSTAKLICIGKTTAQQAKLYSNSVFVSSTTSVESVIVKAVRVLN